MSVPVPLIEAGDARTFGGKAAHLALAAGASLPVPEGVALPWRLVDAVAARDPEATALLAAAAPLGDSLAVRSSAVGEDSGRASFAGQHLSLLGVRAVGLAAAVEAVWRSVREEPARAYRGSLGVAGDLRAGIVVQSMVRADVAGVLFCPNPLTGADEVVIEAAWGLGEAVVSGLVIPDLVRLSTAGNVLERRRGVKDVEVVAVAGGGTANRSISGPRVLAPCLDARQLAGLHRLAIACERAFGGSQDLEWAFAGPRLWLLQRRPVTAKIGDSV
jgi:pyruvate,water dikinase